MIEVSARAVHLIHESNSRNVVLVGLTPDCLRLRLHTGHSVEHRNRAVEHAQRTLDLDGEIDVTGSVDDVDAIVLTIPRPEARRRRRRDRYAALLFLLHPVHDRSAFVDFADLVRDTGVIQDALGRRGLARVDVGHDSDVAEPL